MDDEKLLDELFGKPETNIDIALSYSRVSDFSKNGPVSLIRRSNIDGEGVRIGSVTDDLLNDNEDFKFNDKYYIFEANKPTATTGKLVDIITSNYNKTPSHKKILEIARKAGFWSKWSDDKITETFSTDEFKGYLTAFYKSKNKILITSDDLETSKELARIVKTHDYSKHIFSDRYKKLTQFKFYITYKGVKFRGIMDIVLIDHKTKTVQFIDLKTGKDPALKFWSSFLKWGYYLQEAVYTKAYNVLCKQYKLKDYKLLPFKFLYISRYEKIPLEYVITQKWHDAALKGFTTDNGYKYKGLDQLIDEIKWHWQNKVFDMPRDIYESNGCKILNDKYITVNE